MLNTIDEAFDRSGTFHLVVICVDCLFNQNINTLTTKIRELYTF